MNKLIIISVIDQKKLCTIYPHIAHKPVSRTPVEPSPKSQFNYLSVVVLFLNNVDVETIDIEVQMTWHLNNLCFVIVSTNQLHYITNTNQNNLKFHSFHNFSAFLLLT